MSVSRPPVLYAPAVWLGLIAAPLFAQTLDKGHRILLERGLQTNGLATKDDVFHLDTLRAANFTACYWIWESNMSLLGAFPWGRWAGSEANMPANLEPEYLDNLIAVQLSDEQNLNDPAERAKMATWYSNVRTQYPNTLLYCNSYGGQLTNESLGDFINTSHPDMLSFDTYPFTPTGPPYGSPTNWYGDLQRYRKWGLGTGLPYGIYTQTFHDYMTRDPSESEMRLNYFAALAFGYTFFTDFTYNTGASSLFTSPGGDSYPKPAYYQLQEINRRLRRLGPAMTRLVNVSYPYPDNLTYDGVNFLPGQHLESGTPVSNPRPIDIVSAWTADKNDPYIRGWVVTNLGTRNDGRRGDVWLSWFRVLDESFDGTTYSNQIYFMVTNGLAAADGSAADCQQRIQLNFLGTVPDIQHLRQDDGQVEVIVPQLIPNSGGRKQFNMVYDGGTSELFKFGTAAPFVGATDMGTLPISRFTATPGINRLTLKWVNAPELDYTGVMIRRKVGSYPANAGDGQLVVDKLGAPGQADSYVDTPLQAGTKYYYAAFAHDGTPNYATLVAAPGVPAWQADLDHNGTVNAVDFDRFLMAFGHSSGQADYNAEADYDSDNTVTLVDYQSWLQEYRTAIGNPTAPAPLQVLGDFQPDEHVDALDLQYFEACGTGATIPQFDPACRDADLDSDGDVDQSDFAVLQRCLSGSGGIDLACKY